MAVTRLSDLIVPDVFAAYMFKDTTDKTEIFKSGIFNTDPELAARLAGGGRTFNVPFWNDLDNTEAGIASDDPAISSTPGTVTASKDICRRQVRTRSWSTADLAGILAGSDPMQRILSRVTGYWERQFQTYLVKTLTGLFADNTANDSSDMVNDIATDDSSATTSSELISAEAVIDTAYTMGDNASVLKTLIVHPTVMKRLKKLNLIDFIPDSDGRIAFERYLGYLVIEDDGVYTTTGTNRTDYWSYLIGPGALGFAEVPAGTPVEVERDPEKGNGMGVETIYTRRQFVMHPYGIKWTDTTVGGEFPSNSELATAGNWDRVYAERKQIPIAALVTNG